MAPARLATILETRTGPYERTFRERRFSHAIQVI
jgi:hypothetical protein